MINTRLLFTLGSLAVISLAGWWLMERQIRPTVSDTAQAKRNIPDYSMEGFIATAMNEQGFRRYSLNALSMAHYADDDHADLVQPQISFFKENQPAWKIVAAKGLILGNANSVTFLGKVSIKGLLPDPKNRFTVSTRDLQVVPDVEYAHTTAPVEIKSEQSTVTATGIQVFLAEKRVELLSKVRSIYYLTE